MDDADEISRSGRCLCGAVTYEIRGPLGDIFLCHCEECRRGHGHVGAGTLDQPTGLRVAHWFVSQAADYDTVPDDGLPRHERSAEHERGADHERSAGADAGP